MGCGSSKHQAYHDRLDDLLDQVKTIAPVDVLKQHVQELKELDAYYSSESKAAAAVNAQYSLEAAAVGLTSALVQTVQPKLVRERDLQTLQKLQSMARELDRLGLAAPDASAQVDKRLAVVRQAVAKEMLSGIKQHIQSSAPSMLLYAAPKVLSAIMDAQPYVLEVYQRDSDPALINFLLQQCNVFSSRIVEALEESKDTSWLLKLAGSARALDGLCTSVSAKIGASWSPLAAKVERIREDMCENLTPKLLDKLEGMVEGESIENPTKLLQTLKRLAPLLQPPEGGESKLPDGAAERATEILVKIEALTTTTFEDALASGKGMSLEKLVEFAKEIDDLRPYFPKSDSDGGEREFSRGLEKRKAEVSLKMLLANADGSIAQRSADLEKAFAETDARVKSKSRENLREPCGGNRWRFKLGKGGFKDYSEEDMKQVESMYQEWVAKGRPNDKDSRRFNIEIRLEAPKVSATVSGKSTPRRPRCKYGDKCFRKNVQHRKDFSHPGDADYCPECEVGEVSPTPTTLDPTVNEDALSCAPSMGSMSSAATRVGAETFSLDFLLMTQVNLTRKGRGMRTIQRVEALTYAEQFTKDYFAKVVDFFKEVEGTLTKAEVELRLLGDAEREVMQSQVNDILKTIRAPLSHFLVLAVFVENKKAIDDVVAMLGVHADAEGLGVAELLGETRLQDVMSQFRHAYAEETTGPPQKPWDLVRTMWQKQSCVGPLYKCRMAVVKTKREVRALMRRNAQMRLQALLSEYSGDDDFLARCQGQIVSVLSGAMQRAAVRGPAEELLLILRTAMVLQCDLEPLVEVTGVFIRTSLRGAAGSKYQSTAHLLEVLEVAQDLAKISQKDMREMVDLEALMVPMATVAFRDVRAFIEKADGEASLLHASVKHQVELQKRLNNEASATFDDEFWRLFKPVYDDATKESPDAQALCVEWAVAYCEQLKRVLPPWMMNKDQVEALSQLRVALDRGSEAEIRAAVVFAKQADYKSDAQLLEAYDSAIKKLRFLKRLPSCWQVDDLVGDDSKAKMFKKVDVDSEALMTLFQNLLDETKSSIVTRDRAGAMPRGYKVTKIESVMNADSWGSYTQRCENIAEECSKFPGAAPVADWADFGGPVITDILGQAILGEARLPELSAKANEFLMFHGTKPEAADLIARNHFDMAFACKTGLFGAGLYFAESVSKSDEYVRPNDKNWYPLILCRVTLGRVNYMPKVDPTTDPGRAALEASCLRGDYHCVLGDRRKVRGTYREFIVYDHYQVYPHFIVWYERMSG